MQIISFSKIICENHIMYVHNSYVAFSHFKISLIQLWILCECVTCLWKKTLMWMFKSRDVLTSFSMRFPCFAQALVVSPMLGSWQFYSFSWEHDKNDKNFLDSQSSISKLGTLLVMWILNFMIHWSHNKINYI
jgi:hypothetical protein